MEWLIDPQMWIAFLTLTALELVLGIDNIVFISILAGKLPPEQQQRARILGLAPSRMMRIALPSPVLDHPPHRAALLCSGRRSPGVTSSSSSGGCFCSARARTRSM